MGNQKLKGSSPTYIQCVNHINRRTNMPYRYLTLGAIYPLVHDYGRVYSIMTPRGETHYPKRQFKIVTHPELRYDPMQQGDKEEDI